MKLVLQKQNAVNESSDSEVVSCHVVVDPCGQGSLGHHTALVVDHGSIPEQEESRDSTDSEASGMHGVGIGIDLRDKNVTFRS